MAHVILRVVSRYAPIITFPVAVVIGIIGYNIESYFRTEKQANAESVHDKRDKRLLKQITTEQANDHTSQQSIPILERNRASDLK